MATLRRALIAALITPMMVVPREVSAQCPPKDSARSRQLFFVGSLAEAEITGNGVARGCQGSHTLLRALRLPAFDSQDNRAASFETIDPVISTVWNSAIPVSFNDRGLWAARGLSTSIIAGSHGRFRAARWVVAPEIVTAANKPFYVLPSPDSNRSAFASPFHSGVFSADLPLRQGDQRLTQLLPGESELEIRSGILAWGASSASQWWGPAQHNALLISNNAAGIPRVFLRTANPQRTHIGDIEAVAFLGMLTESIFFDRDPRNDQRSLSAAAVTLRLASDSGVTIGAARTVFARARNFGDLITHVTDAVTDWREPSSSLSPSTQSRRASDQLFSLFGRWDVAEAGLSVYGEWARLRLPNSLRELFVDPQRTQGYTVGITWRGTMSDATQLGFNAEATMLEQTPQVPGAEVPEFYTSKAVPQGYTQQGQVIGAAIGPGSSSQRLGFDVARRRWQVGMNVARIRWEDGAFYRSFPGGLTHYAHDVSLVAGLRGAWVSRFGSIEAEASRTNRLNFQFRTPNAYDPSITSMDVHNKSLSIRLTPHT